MNLTTIIENAQNANSVEEKLQIINTELKPCIEFHLSNLKSVNSPKYNEFKIRFDDIVAKLTETENKINRINTELSYMTRWN